MTLSMNKAVSEIYLAMDRLDPTVFRGQHGTESTFGDAMCFTRSDGILFMDPQKPYRQQYKMICLTAYVTYFSLVIALCENPRMFDGTGIDPKSLSVQEVEML